MDDIRTEAQAVAELTARPEIINSDRIERAPVIVMPNGSYRIIEEMLEKPLRRTGYITIRNLEDFITYTTLCEKDISCSEILISAEGPIEARLDINADGFRDFGARYKPVFTKSFDDWVNANETSMSQEGFALFIEKHIDDIHPAEGMPSAAELLTFCSTVEDSKRVDFKKSVSLQDGRVELIYQKRSDDAREQRLSLFRQFSLALRPFVDRERTYAVTASLRFRIRDGQITFWYELKALDELMEKLRSDIRQEMLSRMGVPVYLADL